MTITTFHVPFPLFTCSVGPAHSTFLLNNEPQRRRGHGEMRVEKYPKTDTKILFISPPSAFSASLRFVYLDNLWVLEFRLSHTK